MLPPPLMMLGVKYAVYAVAGCKHAQRGNNYNDNAEENEPWHIQRGSAKQAANFRTGHIATAEQTHEVRHKDKNGDCA